MGGEAEEEGLHQDFLMGRKERPMCEAVIAITVGDPAGIGPEVVRGALASKDLSTHCRFEVIGGDARLAGEGFSAGIPCGHGARQAFEDLETAAARVISGQYAAIVTGPVNKAAMRAVGFDFPGQTEFFAQRSGAVSHTMCLTGGKLCVALVTAHVALSKVAELLSVVEIERTGVQLAEFLELRLGRKPKIAVAGLNPHAGEDGLFGQEEALIIRPAVASLMKNPRADFTGPCSPDTVFYRAAMGEFDGVVCMYHDQGLIPLKLLAFHEGVNVTLGLPFFRTSPDHGTAYELAGTGRADFGSMLSALNLAAELLGKRGKLV